MSEFEKLLDGLYLCGVRHMTVTSDKADYQNDKAKGYIRARLLAMYAEEVEKRWISASDELPDTDDIYIGFYWFMPAPEWSPWVGEVYFHNCKWYRNEDECIVSHWMHMPESPDWRNK